LIERQSEADTVLEAVMRQPLSREALDFAAPAMDADDG
jgi:hypothetical protein